MRRIVFFVVSAAVWAACEDSSTAPTTLPPGVDASFRASAATDNPNVDDTYLRAGRPNKNQGDEGILRIRKSGQNLVLVRFDDAIIEQVRSAIANNGGGRALLKLTIRRTFDNWGRQGRPIAAHALAQDWTELGATWNCANDTNTANRRSDCATEDEWEWAFRKGMQPIEPTASAEVLITGGLTGTVAFDVTEDVLAFALGEGGENNGWAIKRALENRAGHIQFHSSETELGPVLRFDPCADDESCATTLAQPGEQWGVRLEDENTMAAVSSDGSEFTPIPMGGPQLQTTSSGPILIQLEKVSEGPCQNNLNPLAADVGPCFQVTGRDPVTGEEFADVLFSDVGSSVLPVLETCINFVVPGGNPENVNGNSLLASQLKLIKDDGEILEPSSGGVLNLDNEECREFEGVLALDTDSNPFSRLARALVRPFAERLQPKPLHATAVAHSAKRGGALESLSTVHWSSLQVAPGSPGWTNLAGGPSVQLPAGFGAGPGSACPHLIGANFAWPLGTNANPSPLNLTRVVEGGVDEHPGDLFLIIAAAIDNDIRITVNGMDVTGEEGIGSLTGLGNHPTPNHSAGSHSTAGFDADDFQKHEGCAFDRDLVWAVNVAQNPGVWNFEAPNTIEVRAKDRGVISWLDVQVSFLDEVDEPQIPQ